MSPVLALLLGGRADGWTVRATSLTVIVTMIDLVPRLVPEAGSPEAKDLLNRAHRQWEGYTQVQGAAPDARGRYPYRCTSPLPASLSLPPLPTPPTGPSPRELNEYLAGVDVRVADRNRLRQILRDQGYGLTP